MLIELFYNYLIFRARGASEKNNYTSTFLPDILTIKTLNVY